MSTQQETPSVIIRTEVYWRFVSAYLVLIPLIILFVHIFTGPGVERFGLNWSWGGLVTILSVLHVIASIKKRSIDEHVGVSILGMPVLEKYNPGPLLVPYIPGVVKITRMTRNILQNQFPGEPEQIEWRDEKDVLAELVGGKLPDGKVWPIRAPTGPAREGDRVGGPAWSKDDPFNIQATLSVAFYVRYGVRNLFQFLQVVGMDDPCDPFARLRQQLRDTGERVLLEEFRSRNYALIIEEISTISETMKAAFDTITEQWGVDIAEVGVLMPSLGHLFNTSVREIGQAKAKAQQTRITADADEYKFTKEGAGRGKANKHELAGSIRGLAEATKVGIDPAVIVAATAARNIAENTDYAYFGEFGGLGGIADAFAKNLKQGARDPQKPAPATTGGESS